MKQVKAFITGLALTLFFVSQAVRTGITSEGNGNFTEGSHGIFLLSSINENGANTLREGGGNFSEGSGNFREGGGHFAKGGNTLA